MYLLDTHIFLWWLAENHKLPLDTQEIINDPTNVIFVSSATIWEIAIKAKLEKLEAPTDIDTYIAKSNFRELVITCQQAAYTRKLPYHHKDPFDRMLISQAKLENLTIITHDKIFKKYSAKVKLV